VVDVVEVGLVVEVDVGVVEVVDVELVDVELVDVEVVDVEVVDVEVVDVEVVDVEVVDVEVVDVEVVDVEVVDVEGSVVDGELVEVVDPSSDVDVVEVEVDVVGIDVEVGLVVEVHVVEVAVVEVEVLEVDVVEVGIVVVVGLVPVFLSHDGSTAPGEKRTPGPDLGGGMRVGTVISFAPRYQVVANGSTVDAGVVDEVVDVVAAEGRSGGAASATARHAPWALTSAPAAATTVIPSLNFLMILCVGLPLASQAETASLYGSGQEDTGSPAERRDHPPGSCSAKARNSSGTLLTSPRATAA
jgi:hypothetical protein